MKKILLATVLTALGSVSAFAGDLAAPVVAPVSNWSGFYIGGNVGDAWGTGSTDVVPSQPGHFFFPASLDSSPKGVVGGGQFGYNWQISSFVAGLEADMSSGIKGSGQTPLFGGDPTTASINSTLSWLATVRSRTGFTVTPDFLVYGTLGAAFGRIKDSANTQITTVSDSWPASLNNLKLGWTAGAGAEWMFARNWSAKVEYLHIDMGTTEATSFDTADPTIDTTTYKWRHQYDTVRFGVNYHFN